MSEAVRFLMPDRPEETSGEILVSSSSSLMPPREEEARWKQPSEAWYVSQNTISRTSTMKGNEASMMV